MATPAFVMRHVLVAAQVLALVACSGGSGGGGDGSPVAVTGVTLDKHDLSLAAGSSERLVATVLPENATTRTVTWSIAGAPGITVQQDGTVSTEPELAGTATVTVTTDDGHFTDSCDVTAVFVAPGRYRFVAAENSGLKVVDAGAPHDPHLETTQPTKSTAMDVFVRGDLAYVAESGAGLEIFDVADPAAPVKVGECATRGWQYATAVWVDGNHAYVADDYMGLTVIDVTDPAHPALVGSYDTAGAAIDVAVSQGRAYLADKNGGLAIVDVADPQHPALVTRYDAYTNVNAVAVVGDRAFLVDSYAGLVILDVAVPSTPVQLGTYDTAGFPRDVFVAGGYAYVADRDEGLAIIDIGDPAAPVLAGTLDTEGSAVGVTVAGDHAFVADVDGGLVIVDVGDPIHPTLAGVYNLTTNPQGIDWVEDSTFAYVADDTSGLRVVGWLDERTPGLVASLDTPGHAYDVEYWADRVFLADGGAGALQIINVTVPGTPGLIETVTLEGVAKSVAIEAGHAYVSTGPEGLFTWDLADPTDHAEFRLFTAQDQVVLGSHVFVASDLDPRFVVVHLGLDQGHDEYDFDGSGLGRTSGVARYGNLVYVTSGTGVFAINVENPDAPFVVGGPWAAGVHAGRIVADVDYLYLAGLSSGLTILNRSTGDVVGSVAAGGLTGLDVHGNRAIACGGNGFINIDVSDRAHPTVLFSEGRFLAVR